MHIRENVELKNFSTMRLGGRARYLIEISSEDEIVKLSDWIKPRKVPVIVVGGGSNIVWRDDGFAGLVVVNKMHGKKVLSKNGKEALVEIAAGENWDAAVAWTVDQNLSGVETLSLIPGTAGATPVQNLEAYGQQIADTLQKVRVFDLKDFSFKDLSTKQCKLSYRNSRFKNLDHGRFIICSIELKLSYGQIAPPFHRGLQQYIEQYELTDFSPANIRNAVIEIRSRKLPDPAKVANNGSFFKNPIVDQHLASQLLEQFPNILHYPLSSGKVKLSAMWLIEHAGFTPGYHDSSTGMGLWPKHALVMVNEKAQDTADLLTFKAKIVDKVQDLFGVTLEQEPELLP